MLKKILYVVASLLLGLMIILYVVNTSFYTTFAKLNAEAVAAKEYDTAERFFSRVYDNEKFYVGNLENADKTTTHVEIYSALNDGIRYYTPETEGAEKVQYYTLESSIQISIFHLPSSFSTADKIDGEGNYVSRGGAKFIYSETESAFFPFSTEIFDYYSLQESFSFLGLSIADFEYYEALDAAGIEHSAIVNKIEIVDGDGQTEYSITFEEGKNPSFDTKFATTFNEVVTEYNTLKLELAKGKTLTDEQTSGLETKYFEVAENSGYVLQHSTKIIYRSGKFITRVIIAAVIYTAIVIMIGWLIFRKKKAPKYIPPGYRNRMQQKPTPKREPEQFSREVFDLEKEAVVENTSEEK